MQPYEDSDRAQHQRQHRQQQAPQSDTRRNDAWEALREGQQTSVHYSERARVSHEHFDEEPVEQMGIPGISVPGGGPINYYD